MELSFTVFADNLFAACRKRLLRHADVDLGRLWPLECELRAIYDHELSNMQVSQFSILI
jgi:hypothetical protein